MSHINDKGYIEGKYKHSKLLHRQIAYQEVYLKNREEYPLPFYRYQVHHIDRNKLNNDSSNFELLTPKDHMKLHGIDFNAKEKSMIVIIIASFMIMGGISFILKESHLISNSSYNASLPILFMMVFMIILICMIWKRKKYKNNVAIYENGNKLDGFKALIPILIIVIILIMFYQKII
jgi:hypothetical protein